MTNCEYHLVPSKTALSLMSGHSIHPRLCGASFLLFRIKTSLCHTLTLVYLHSYLVLLPLPKIWNSQPLPSSAGYFFLIVHPEALSFHGAFVHIAYPKHVSLALSFLPTRSQQNTFHILWKIWVLFFIKYVHDLCIYMDECAHECRHPGKSGGVWDPQFELQVIVSPLTKS